MSDLKSLKCPMLVARGDDDFWPPKEVAEESDKAFSIGELVRISGVDITRCLKKGN